MYSPLQRTLKRSLDVAAASAGLAAIWPLLAAVAGAIRLASPGPVLFRQVRVGRGKRAFVMLKFRTMHVGTSGALITSSGDSRIFPLGRLLRKSKVDELPELWNVLVGDMSLVGPRPEVPYYVEQHYRPEWDVVFDVRPGLTDPATIHYRNEEALLAGAEDPEAFYVSEVLPDKLARNLAYLERATVVADLVVIARTFLAILRG